MTNSGPGRRAVVLGGLAAAAGVGGFVVRAERGRDPLVSPAGPAPGRPTGRPTGLPGHRTNVRVEQVRSAVRGRDVTLVTVRPAGHLEDDLAVCLGLHGRYADARQILDAGVADRLDEAVAAGGPPFAVAAVDGGDTYWHARSPADDPLRMLTNELPGWLAERGLATASAGAPRGAFGISMGGFGALRYARARGAAGRDAEKLAAAAVLSPALFATWGDASVRHAFADRADWAAHEPLLHLPALSGLVSDGLALGVWCGDADPFLPVARRLGRAVAGAAEHVGPGAHTMAYWRGVLPAVLAFLGAHVT